MPLPLPRAAALLVGAGGAGAATAAALVLADLQGAMANSALRVAGLAFGFLLTLPLIVAAVALLRPGNAASPQMRGLTTLGTMLWLLGIGGDLFLPAATASALLLWHSLAFVGAVAFLLAGLAGRPLSGLREGETAAERRRRLRGEG